MTGKKDLARLRKRRRRKQRIIRTTVHLFVWLGAAVHRAVLAAYSVYHHHRPFQLGFFSICTDGFL